MMENVKKGRKFVSIKNSRKWKPEICTKFRFRKSKFSEKQNCRNLPLIRMQPSCWVMQPRMQTNNTLLNLN